MNVGDHLLDQGGFGIQRREVQRGLVLLLAARPTAANSSGQLVSAIQFHFNWTHVIPLRTASTTCRRMYACVDSVALREHSMPERTIWCKDQ